MERVKRILEDVVGGVLVFALIMWILYALEQLGVI